jgi:sirohydrochlorin ferrochelatase
LGAGRHVQEDLPRELQLARGELPLEVLPTLGHNPQVKTILDHLFQKLAPQADVYRLLVAHGSRYAGGNKDFEALARSLKATIAYWSVEPSLTQAIKVLGPSPGKPLILQPYFLFAGGLTDALWAQVDALKQAQPQCPFYWGNPLAQSSLFAPLIAQILFL